MHKCASVYPWPNFNLLQFTGLNLDDQPIHDVDNFIQFQMKDIIFTKNNQDHIMDNDYHNPYDHRMVMKPSSANHHQQSSDSDHQSNHYEAPSCLVRNPSGSLFIPSSGKSLSLDRVERNLLLIEWYHLQGPKSIQATVWKLQYFLSLYLKSILEDVNVQKMPFLQFQGL